MRIDDGYAEERIDDSATIIVAITCHNASNACAHSHNDALSRCDVLRRRTTLPLGLPARTLGFMHLAVLIARRWMRAGAAIRVCLGCTNPVAGLDEALVFVHQNTVLSDISVLIGS
jgi:hypothetical protein